MQGGGCARFTRRQPCAVEPFSGARFHYLAANVLGVDGKTLFPATGIKTFGSGRDAVTIGFIGMTLKGTGAIVTPSGVRGVSFADEAATANALVPALKAQGADAIVLLIHQGGKTPVFSVGNGCDGLDGGIVPILAKLDPAITTVVSGHTHWAYVCQNGPGGTSGDRLLTSAGKNGYFFSDIRLHFDRASHRLIAQQAANQIVGNGERGQAPDVKALVDRYAEAVAPIAHRVIGRLGAPATRDENDRESSAADLIADALLAATRGAETGRAQIGLVNVTGVRLPLAAGEVRYADAFAMMPFGNNLVVMTLTGAQLKTVLEQQFAGVTRASGRPAALAPSQGFNYSVNLRRPANDRVVAMTLNGKAIDAATGYRVVVIAAGRLVGREPELHVRAGSTPRGRRPRAWRAPGPRARPRRRPRPSPCGGTARRPTNCPAKTASISAWRSSARPTARRRRRGAARTGRRACRPSARTRALERVLDLGRAS